jgi:hypothetical protein
MDARNVRSVQMEKKLTLANTKKNINIPKKKAGK